MPMRPDAKTLTEHILGHACGKAVRPGELVVVRPDVAMGHDSLAPEIIRVLMDELGVDRVHDPEQIVLVMDHVAPATTVETANAQRLVRRFAAEQGIRLFDVGRGISHQVLIEEGIARPGRVVLGSDSHSTSYGAVGAFGSGLGSTDIALIWATGRTWLRVPETIRVRVDGRFRPGVDAKDLALKLCGELTTAGADYAAVEYHGLDWLPLDGRQTLASMAAELGAKAALVPPVGTGIEDYGHAAPEWLRVDPDAGYRRTLSVDLERLEPQVAVPWAVDRVVDLSEVAGTPVDAVFLGTCTNGRYEDLRAAADILAGRRIAPGIRFLVSPASSLGLERAARDGTLATLVSAGATLTTPGCGACLGRQGALGHKEVCLSTGNRNFRGRMGAPTAEVYLASPAVAAATAVAGRIADPRDL